MEGRLLAVLVAIVIGAGFWAGLHQAQPMINEATRGNVSQYVTDQVCMVGEDPGNASSPTVECPEALYCYHEFDPDRIGRNITEPRCVEPEYREQYCGLLEGTTSLNAIPNRISCKPVDNVVTTLVRELGCFLGFERACIPSLY